VRAEESDFDKALASYQKSALAFFYPALINFVAIAFGFSLSIMGGFALAGNEVLVTYISAHPFESGAVWNNVLGTTSALVVVIVSAYLTFLIAKGKFWPIPVLTGLYVLDFAYGIALYFPIYGQLSLANWIIMLVTHVTFLSLFSLNIVKYAKLSRLLKKSRAKNE
jgi:hypothetical protein